MSTCKNCDLAIRDGEPHDAYGTFAMHKAPEMCIARLVDRVEKLEAPLCYVATCPCCEEQRKCRAGCTFAEDAPDAHEEMIEARRLLFEERD